MRRASLRTRLARYITLVTVSLLLASGVAIYIGVGQALSRLLDGTLESIAATEAMSAFDEPASVAHVHDRGRQDTTKVSCIVDSDGRVLAASANLAGVTEAYVQQARARAFAGDSTAGYATLTLRGQRWRCIAYPLTAPQGRRLVDYVAVPLGPLEDTMGAVGAVVLGVVLLGAASAWWASDRLGRRLTDPLRDLAEAADRLREGTQTVRLPAGGGDAELRSLTDALNTMLERMHAALGRERDLNESQRRFVADAAHELRSPLTNLHCALEVTLRRPRDAEAYRSALETALTQVQRLTRLSNDLLTLSRADAGQLQLNLGPCDLGRQAARTADVMRSRFDEAGVRLEVQVEEAPVWGDSDRLEQVVTNLLDNALRHSPPGGTVTLRAQGGEVCRLIIEDEGPGVPLEERERIFERFHRVDKARARAAGGSGLGLAIAQGIVHAHQGQIHVEPREPGGARFVCGMPLRGVGQEPR